MQTLSSFIDARLARGQGFFSRHEAMTSLGLSEAAFHETARRMQNKKKLIVIPKREFYLIVRPEDTAAVDHVTEDGSFIRSFKNR